MLVLTLKPRPAVLQALTQGVSDAERLHEVAITLRTARDMDGVTRDFGIASLVILDLSTIPQATALQIVNWQLEVHPFVAVDLVAAPAPNLSDQQICFQFGKAGVQHMHLPDAASDPALWVQRIGDLGNFNLIGQVHRQLQRHIPPDERGEFLAKFLEFSHVASVKVLADKVYPSKTLTQAYKRRLLWQECKRHGWHSPEAILSATRLLVLKSILDADVWTTARVARHFGYDSPRHLNRSCKNRFDMSVSAIRQAKREDVFALARLIFYGGDPPMPSIDA